MVKMIVIGSIVAAVGYLILTHKKTAVQGPPPGPAPQPKSGGPGITNVVNPLNSPAAAHRAM